MALMTVYILFIKLAWMGDLESRQLAKRLADAHLVYEEKREGSG